MATNVTLNNPTERTFIVRDSNNNIIAQYPTGGSGNPFLRPITSDNYDVTAEWYFAPTGSFTIGGFYKKVDGFLRAAPPSRISTA